jgi:hypothetical protein
LGITGAAVVDRVVLEHFFFVFVDQTVVVEVEVVSEEAAADVTTTAAYEGVGIAVGLVCSKLAPGSPVAVVLIGDSVVSGVGIGVEGEVFTASVLGAEDSTGTSEEGVVPDEPKLLDAVVEPSLVTVTLFTMTTSPSTLVTLTSTVVVPKPIEFSK